MHGVPKDLDLARFKGARLGAVHLAENELQFLFCPSDYHARDRPETLLINVEGGWELRDSADNIVDHSEENRDREAYRLHRILSKEVVGTTLDPPHSFALAFDNGHVLRIFDDDEQFHSVSIHPGDIYI